MKSPPSFQEEFTRIDAMRSMREMHDAVAAIPFPQREALIVYAAGVSRFQWTWSSIAKENGINISRIPNPNLKSPNSRIERGNTMPNDLPKSGLPNTIPAPSRAKAPSIESIGQKVVRRLKDQTNRLMDRLGRSDDVAHNLIHEALLHAWTDGHDDASTASLRMVDEAHEVLTPSKPRREYLGVGRDEAHEVLTPERKGQMSRCKKRDSNGIQCEISGPHKRCAAPQALERAKRKKQ